MIANDKTMKMIRDAYARNNLPTWPEEPPLLIKNCFCLAVSLCSVMVILASIIASM